MVRQHSGAGSSFKAGSIFRELWNNCLPVLIAQLIHQINYAVLEVLVLSEGRETSAVFLTQTFHTIDGYQ